MYGLIKTWCDTNKLYCCYLEMTCMHRIRLNYWPNQASTFKSMTSMGLMWSTLVSCWSVQDLYFWMMSNGSLFTGKKISWGGSSVLCWSMSFVSGYDFGYLLKLLTCTSMPADESEFFEILRIYFPCIYDIKYLMRSCKNLKGGLQDIADDLQVGWWDTMDTMIGSCRSFFIGCTSRSTTSSWQW